MKMKREDVRNIAIIAHVDHGKTTLVDQLLRQSGVFRVGQEVQERVMDSNDIERERGITILSKNTAVFYKDTKINIIDTPGHADFGGEVERVLKMVNGVVLVVDAYEGPMPQTKFVLQKALELDLSVIVCINKVDRPEARPSEVIDETLELMMDLDASDEQLDCPFIFASARGGFARYHMEDDNMDMGPLFETIISHTPAPEGDPDADTQVLISTIDYNEFVGRIGIGKVDNGGLKVNQECVLVNHHDPDKFKKIKIGKLYEFDGLKRVEVQQASVGSIVAISGIADIHIGDTICSPDHPEAIPFQKISEPTIAMYFMVNDSPLAGQEGKFITSRHLRDRLFRELNTDVSLRVEETDSADCFKVSGRGELHLSVLIENMRREGFEFAVSKAEVLYSFFPLRPNLRRLKNGTLAAAASACPPFWYALRVSSSWRKRSSSFWSDACRRNSSSLPILSLTRLLISWLSFSLFTSRARPIIRFMICWNCSIFSSMATTEPVSPLTVLKDVFPSSSLNSRRAALMSRSNISSESSPWAFPSFFSTWFSACLIAFS